MYQRNAGALPGGPCLRERNVFSALVVPGSSPAGPFCEREHPIHICKAAVAPTPICKSGRRNRTMRLKDYLMPWHVRPLKNAF